MSFRSILGKSSLSRIDYQSLRGLLQNFIQVIKYHTPHLKKNEFKWVTSKPKTIENLMWSEICWKNKILCILWKVSRLRHFINGNFIYKTWILWGQKIASSIKSRSKVLIIWCRKNPMNLVHYKRIVIRSREDFID